MRIDAGFLEIRESRQVRLGSGPGPCAAGRPAGALVASAVAMQKAYLRAAVLALTIPLWSCWQDRGPGAVYGRRDYDHPDRSDQDDHDHNHQDDGRH